MRWSRLRSERGATRIAIALLGMILATLRSAPTSAAPHEPRSELGASDSGLCGLDRLGHPRCPSERITLSATSGYGFTERYGRLTGGHHRVLGVLGISYVPLDWLALALQLDGRVDIHTGGPRGTSSFGTGQPTLLGRLGWDLPRSLVLGAELGFWIPGREAPSLAFDSTSLEVKALLSSSSRERFTWLSHLGVRFDRSAHSAPNLARVRPDNRAALGLSEFHAILLGAGLAYRVRTAVLLFAEGTADLLVGAQAPPCGHLHGL